MFRHLPILLIILTVAPAARAEQSFFERFFGSFNSNTPATSAPAGSTVAAATEVSEPLALQATETRVRHKKRSHASHRHRQTIPEGQQPASERQPQPRATTSEQEKSTAKSPEPEPGISRETSEDPNSVDETVPANSDPTPSAVWPDPAPPKVAPWPVKSTPIEASKSGEPVDLNTGKAVEVGAPVQIPPGEEANASLDDKEPQSFIDRERYILASFSAAWVLLGIVMFVFPRPFAKVIVAWRRRRLPAGPPASAPTVYSPPHLRLILENAAREEPTTEEGDTEERRALSIG